MRRRAFPADLKCNVKVQEMDDFLLLSPSAATRACSLALLLRALVGHIDLYYIIYYASFSFFAGDFPQN